MVVKSKIEWCDSSWNTISGCSRISPGCMNCYAEGIAKRFSGPGLPYEGLIARTGQWNGQIKFIEEKLTEPLRWKKPRMIFVNSMSDLFHENVSEEWIDRIFAVMALCPQHTFQVLTKRPERMLNYFQNHFSRHKVAVEARKFTGKANVFSDTDWGCDPDICNGEFPLKNVWLGVSCENQETADERIPLLLQTPAAVRWISAEPLLGPVSLRWLPAWPENAPNTAMNPNNGGITDHLDGLRRLDWVVVGGESGRGARPMHPDWARSLRDQCKAAGVRFFFKQWGEWREPLPGEEYDTTHGRAGKPPAFIVSEDGTVHCFEGDFVKNGKTMICVGKKRAGRLLDGELWDQYPEGRNV